MMFARLRIPNLLLTGLLVSQVSGSSLSKSSESLSLVARQGNGIQNAPPQCESVCDPLDAAIEKCTTQACVCTAANAQLLESCIDCIVSVTPSQRMPLQAMLDHFTGLCQGFSVGSLTISANSPSSTGSSRTLATSSVTTSSSSVATSSSSVAASSSSIAASSSSIAASSSITSLTVSTPTIPATTSTPNVQSNNSSSPTATPAPTTSSSGASHLVIWNGALGAGAGVVAGLAMALV